MRETKAIATVNEECIVRDTAILLPAVCCRYNLASAGWERERFIIALIECADPPWSIAREEAEALANSIIASTGKPIAFDAGPDTIQIDDRWPEGGVKPC